MKQNLWLSTFCVMLFSLFLGGCAPRAYLYKAQEIIAEVFGDDSIPIGAEEYAKSIQLKSIVVNLPKMSPIGRVYSGPSCTSRHDLIWQKCMLAITSDDLDNVCREELEKANYPVIAEFDASFDDPSTWKAELLIAGTVKDLKANLCYPLEGSLDSQNAKGEAYVSMAWQVYSRRDKKLIYEGWTVGSSVINEPGPHVPEDLILKSLAMATQNLLADRNFYEVVTSSEKTSPELASS